MKQFISYSQHVLVVENKIVSTGSRKAMHALRKKTAGGFVGITHGKQVGDSWT